jgi:integrase
MAKGFTVLTVKNLPDGRHVDPACSGLYLRVQNKGKARSWEMRYTRQAKAHHLSLGSLASVGLSEARDKVTSAKAMLAKGQDPTAAKAVPAVKPVTFKDDALAYHAHNVNDWDKLTAKYWLASMERYAFPVIGNIDTAKITVDDIVSVILPIWTTINPTALRIHGQIRATINYAMDCDSDESRFGGKRNPCDKALIRFPKGFTKPQVNHASISWKEAPALFKALGAMDCQPARALQFLLLAGTPRAAEIIGAKWSEIDGNTWHVPADRMKSGEARDIPLTQAALDLLASLTTAWNHGEGFIFTGRKGKTIGGTTFGRKRERIGGTFVPFSGAMHKDAMQNLLRTELKIDCHVHGLRSTFKTWVQDNTALATDWDASELCLDHETGNKVQRAYARSDMMPERRALLERWAAYLMG